MKKVIGIYGGSFNPPHLGHLNLATEMLEAHHLHEVWFCPTGFHPQKKDPVTVSAEHRLNMLKLAIEEEPRFHISEIEVNRKGPSYTIDTLKDLIEREGKKHDPYTFALILGEDAARGFATWKEPEEIIKYVKLLVGRRGESGKEMEPLQGTPEIVAALLKGWTPTRMMDISSREIRHRLLNKKYCYHLLPTKVIDYINKNQLYYNSLNELRFL